MKICLLVIDVQKSYVNKIRGRDDVLETAEVINYVADLLRSNGHMVVHIQDVEDVEIIGEESLEIIPEIEISDKDKVIQKVYSNAFWSTELEGLLTKSDVDMVICAGYAAEYCVLATYNGASERGFKAVMLKDGLLAKHKDSIVSTYRDRNLISYPVVEYIVGE